MKYYSKYEIGEVVEKELTKMMKSFGFQVDPYDDIMYKYYEIYSRYHVSENGGFFYKQEGLTKRISCVDTIWEDLSDIVQIQRFKHRPTISLYMSFCFPEIVDQLYFDDMFKAIKSPATDEGIEQYIEIIKPIFENYIFPASEKFNDIREIDKEVNTDFNAQFAGFLGTDGALFKRVIIAKLAGNPRYNELVEFHRERYSKAIETITDMKEKSFWINYNEVFEEVLRRLENVAPLENPMFK